MTLEPFRLDGEVDMERVRQIGPILSEHADRIAGDVVIDCSQLSFIDSMGLDMLINLQTRLATEGRRVILDRLPAPYRRLLQICGLEELFGLPKEPLLGES